MLILQCLPNYNWLAILPRSKRISMKLTRPLPVLALSINWFKENQIPAITMMMKLRIQCGKYWCENGILLMYCKLDDSGVLL